MPPSPAYAQPELFVTPERAVRGAINAYKPDQLPAGTTREFIDVFASDGAFSWGLLHLPAGPQPTTVAMFMHPRENQTRQYLTPYLLEAGYAVWGQTSRALNNDTDMVHEEVTLDIAAGIRHAQGPRLRPGSCSSAAAAAPRCCPTTSGRRRAHRPNARATAPHGTPTGFADERDARRRLLRRRRPPRRRGRDHAQHARPADRRRVQPDGDRPGARHVQPRQRLPARSREPSNYDPDWLAGYRDRASVPGPAASM